MYAERWKRGVYMFFTGLEAKKLGLLREMIPGPGVITALLNPNNPDAENQSRELQAAARTLGGQIKNLQRHQRDRNRCSLRNDRAIASQSTAHGLRPAFRKSARSDRRSVSPSFNPDGL